MKKLRDKTYSALIGHFFYKTIYDTKRIFYEEY